MGCKTCKDKKGPIQNNGNNNRTKRDTTPDDDTISFLPDKLAAGDFSGNFALKIVAFIVMIMAIPLIILVLMGQMFLTFFMPKSLPKVSKRVVEIFMLPVKKYSLFRHDREVKRRKRQFEKNMSYEEDTVLSDIEEDDEDEDSNDITIYKNNNEKE